MKMSKTLTIGLAVTAALHASSAWAADKEPVLKAIDPSTLKLDDGSGDAASFNNTPVKGRPLGNTFQPINQNAPGDLLNNGGGGSGGASGATSGGSAASQAGFGNALSPETDEPVASAQEEERVNNLEQKAFGTNYHEHEVPDRLDHLEKEVFGSSGHGAIGDRIAKLEVKLLGGTGFGAGTTASNPAKAPSQSNGDGWLTQPAGTPMQPPQAASQSELQPPPLQQATLPPQMQIPQQQMQMPQQQMQMPQQQMQRPQQQQQMSQQQMQMPQQQMQMPQQQQQMPPRQMQPSQNRNGPGNLATTNSTAAPPSMGLTADAALVANSLFFDVRAGDYLSDIHRFPGPSGQPGQSYAHWRSFPVRLRLPKDSPESWQRALEAVVARWDQYVPVKLALPLEAAPVDVTWVNQLPPKTLAVTRLNIAHGEMRVIVYMLRPSYYPPEIPERTLGGIFMHELGHAIGLFGHSDKITDLMYPAEVVPASKGKPAQVHFAPVSTRDINTLKKVYESPALPQGVSLEQPLEWALKIK